MKAKEFTIDYFGHTSQSVSMNKIFVCMEQYANQRVIEELEKIEMKYNTDLPDTINDVIERIKELKQ